MSRRKNAKLQGRISHMKDPVLNGSLGVGEKWHTQTRESLGAGDKSASVCVYLVLSCVYAFSPLPASCLMHVLLFSSTSCSTQARTPPTPRFYLFKYPPTRPRFTRAILHRITPLSTTCVPLCATSSTSLYHIHSKTTPGRQQPCCSAAHAATSST